MIVRIGDRGIATTPLRPGGFVTIVDVRHSARCPSGYVDANMEVVVIGGDNQGLIVRIIQTELVAGELPGHGNVVYSSFGDKIQTVGKEAQQRLALQRRRLIARAWMFGAGWGLLCAVAAVIRLHFTWPPIATNSTYALTPLIVCVGTLWGAALCRFLFGAFEQVEHEPSPRFTIISTIISLSGGAITLVVLLPHRGVVTTILMTFCATLLLAFGLLGLGAACEWAGNFGEGGGEPGGTLGGSAEGPQS